MWACLPSSGTMTTHKSCTFTDITSFQKHISPMTRYPTPQTRYLRPQYKARDLNSKPPSLLMTLSKHRLTQSCLLPVSEAHSGVTAHCLQSMQIGRKAGEMCVMKSSSTESHTGSGAEGSRDGGGVEGRFKCKGKPTNL